MRWRNRAAGKPWVGYVLVMGAAAWLVLAAGATPTPRWLDGQAFALVQRLIEPASADVPVLQVHFEDDAAQPQETRLQALRQLGVILEAGLQRARAVALVADNGLRNALTWSPEGRELAAKLEAAGVLLGIPVDAVPPAAWGAESGHASAFAQGRLTPRYLERWPYAPTVPEARLAPGHSAVNGLRALPVAAAGDLGASRPLLWHLPDAAVPDLAAQLYAGPGGRVLWRPDGVQLGEVGVRTDPLGRVYPRFSSAAGTLPAIPQADAQDLLFAHERPLLAGQIVIFGMRDDPDAANLAAALASLYAPALAHTPGWGIALEKILVLLICAYLLLVVPHLRAGVALLLSVLIGVLIATAQLGVFLVHAYWLTLAVPLTFLLLGQILVTFTARGRANWNALIERSDKTALTLARRQLEQGELDGALESISGCAGSEQLRELLYEIGIGYERKRHYEKAANVFGSLVRGKRGFRDAAERLAVLVQLRPAPSWQPGRSLSGGTLVMPQGNLARPLLGRYEIERELGRGAVGVVYLGKDPKIGRQVAIKTVDLTQFEEDPQEFKLRFFREAEAAGRLSHPNIVTIYDVGEEKDLAFIAMDYMPGRALSAHTRPENLLAPALVLQLLAQVADALDYAHRQGVIHRDIKPDNLIYDEQDGRVKVADFGIARLADTTRTRTGAVLGSPSYMSPEQITGQNVDGRSDIFSLGVTVFQLITGQLPFQGDTVAALAYQISQQKHKDLRSLRPELSPAIGRLLNKALQKQPERRYASAAEFAAALRKSASATTTSTAS